MARSAVGDDRALEAYFSDIAQSKPLPRQREVELAARIRQGDLGARDELVQANLRFVVEVATQFRLRGLSLAELVSAGNVGLLTAADRFDGTRGYKFISYAVWWIRQAILQALAEQTRRESRGGHAFRMTEASPCRNLSEGLGRWCRGHRSHRGETQCA